jgi:hypothetical protein
MQEKYKALNSKSFDRNQKAGKQATYCLEDTKLYTSQGKYT